MSNHSIKELLHRKRRLEIIIPMFTFIVALVLMLVPLQSLLSSNTQGSSQMQLEMGDHKFHIYSQQECIGELEYTLAQGRLLAFVVKTVMRVEEAGQVKPISLSFRSFYNPLQQLVQAVVKLRFDGYLVNIETENVHPISVDINVTSDKVNLNRLISIPGPVLLEPNRSDELYTLRYPKLAGLVPQSAFSSGEQFSKSLALRLEKAGNNGACPQESALNIDSLKTVLTAMSPLLLKQGIPGFANAGK